MADWEVLIGGPIDSWLDMSRAEANYAESYHRNRVSYRVKYFPVVPAAIIEPAYWNAVADQASDFISIPSDDLDGKIYTAEEQSGVDWAVCPPINNIELWSDWYVTYPGEESEVPRYMRFYTNEDRFRTPWFMKTAASNTVFQDRPFRAEMALYSAPTNMNHYTLLAWGARGGDTGFEVAINATGDITISEVGYEDNNRILHESRTEKDLRVTLSDPIWFEVWPISDASNTYGTSRAVLSSNLLDEDIIISSEYNDRVVANDTEVVFGRTFGGSAAVRVLKPVFYTGTGYPDPYYGISSLLYSPYVHTPWAEDGIPIPEVVGSLPSSDTLIAARIDYYDYVVQPADPGAGTEESTRRYVSVEAVMTTDDSSITPWLFNLGYEFDESRDFAPMDTTDVTCYVSNISRSAAINEPTEVSLTLTERESDEHSVGSLQALLHNKTDQRVRIKDPDGNWFFNGYIRSVSSSPVDRQGKYMTYELNCMDYTLTLEDATNFSGAYTLNDVSDTSVQEVVETILERCGIDAVDITVDPLIADLTIKAGLDKGEKLIWENTRSAADFISGFLSDISAGSTAYGFNWDGTYFIDVIPNTDDDVSAIPDSNIFYIRQDDAICNNSKNWVRALNDVTERTHDFFNAFIGAGSNKKKYGTDRNRNGNFFVTWYNHPSILDPDSDMFVGKMILRGAQYPWINDRSMLTWVVRSAARIYGHAIPRNISFTSFYDEAVKPGQIINVKGPFPEEPPPDDPEDPESVPEIDYMYEEDSYWIISSMETIVNRNSPTDGEKFEAETSFELEIARPRILDLSQVS